MLLINLADFYPYVEISPNIDTQKTLEPYILQAQMFDLKPILGDSFYLDLVTDPAVAKYVDLIQGKTYIPSGTTDAVAFDGLKPMLVYFAYARYLTSANIRPTMTGFVRKETQYSEPLRYDELVRRSAEYRSMANSYENGLNRFIGNYKSVYPLYYRHCGSSITPSFRMRVI